MINAYNFRNELSWMSFINFWNTTVSYQIKSNFDLNFDFDKYLNFFCLNMNKSQPSGPPCSIGVAGYELGLRHYGNKLISIFEPRSRICLISPLRRRNAIGKSVKVLHVHHLFVCSVQRQCKWRIKST